MTKLTPLLAAVVLGAAACSDSKDYETAMCALADISGTYAQEKQNVARIIKAGVVPHLMPGDSLFFITIDSNSYNEDDLVASLTLDYVPSKANEQKLAFAEKLDAFAESNARSQFTDISGAMMLCKDYLSSTGAGNQAMLIFSDMKEELQPGSKRQFSENEFEGIDIAAMNVIKLNADSADPAVYRKRLEQWEQTVTDSGALSWSNIVDPVKIPEYIRQLK